MEAQRQTAHQLWISTLLTGTFVKTAGEWEPNYLQLEEKKISRVNLLCHVVDKFTKEDESYSFLTLDDGSAKIALKTWKEEVKLFSDIHVGDLILVVGKVKDFNNKIFISPEIVKKLDNPLWAKARHLFLKKEHGEPQKLIQEETTEQDKSSEETFTVVEEKVSNEPFNKRQKLLDLIEQLDTNNGAEQTLVVHQSGILKEEAQNILDSLIKEGEVFEIHPGKLRTTL